MSVREINVDAFAGGIKAFGIKTRKQAVDRHRAITLGLEADIKTMWPVDTGHSRRNWHSSAGTPDDQVIQAGEFDSAGAIAGLKLGEPTYVQNAVPYAQSLEDGHSKKMPAGAVAAAALKWSASVLAFMLLSSVASAQISGIAANALPRRVTVAQLPVATTGSHALRIVTNGASATDCTVGGGSTVVLCMDTGAAWEAVAGGGGGGATTFLGLTDTPASYVGQTLKLLRVNAGETAVEFTAPVVDTDTTCLDAGVSCLFAASASEGGAAATGDSATAFFSAGTIEVARLPAASETAAGIAELATSAETTAGLVVQASDTRLSDSRAPNGTASGDLSGSYPGPAVVDDSHAHGASTISGLDAGDVTTGSFGDARVDDTITASSYLPLAGGNVTGPLGVDNQQEFRFYETDANGANYIAFVAPAAITTTATCTLENDSSPIPDSCVGDGTDAGGSGDVVGPASATDNALVRFDLTTGKLVQNSTVTLHDTTGEFTNSTANTGFKFTPNGTGAVVVPDGTAALPGLRFSGSAADAGFYGAGATTLRWTSNGGSNYVDFRSGGILVTYPGAAMIDATTSATLPVIVPSYAVTATGLGAASSNDLRLIANSVSGLGVTDTATTIYKKLVEAVSTLTIADNGLGTAATGTLTPTTSYVEVTCSDANGCDVTVSETGAVQGQVVTIVNVSANVTNWADTAGVTELPAGGVALGQEDTMVLRYRADRFVREGGSDN